MSFQAEAVTFAAFYSYSSDQSDPGQMIVAGTEVEIILEDEGMVLLRTAEGRIGMLPKGSIERYGR